MTITAKESLRIAASVRRPQGRDRRFGRRLLRLADVIADVGALGVALAAVRPPVGLGAAYGALVLAANAVGGEYRLRLSARLYDVLPRVFARAALPLLLLVPFAGDAAHASALLRLGAAFALAVSALRTLAVVVLRAARARGRALQRTLVVGAGEHGRAIASTLLEHPEYGLQPIGFLDRFDDPMPLPVLDTTENLESALETFDVRVVVVAFGGTRDDDLVPILRACDAHRVEVYVVPRFFELGVVPEGAGADDLWGFPLVRLRRRALQPTSRVVKRSFDVAVASVLLLLTAPIVAAAALAVKLTSRGPVLFRQKRVAAGGRIIEILKFRTMQVNDDSDTQWTVDDDDRVTAVGRVLRATSVDELPQLVNVLRGEMSLVGPRPERPHFVAQFDIEVPRYGDRHRVPAGVTGWAQVHGLRGDTSIAERSRFDNAYIENWSVWRDVGILCHTVFAVAAGVRCSIREVFRRRRAAPSDGAAAKANGSGRVISLSRTRRASAARPGRAPTNGHRARRAVHVPPD
jgi:exopolysaccharide biosynthesis polyprenyl glycosylphosphotransferase